VLILQSCQKKILPSCQKKIVVGDNARQRQKSSRQFSVGSLFSRVNPAICQKKIVVGDNARQRQKIVLSNKHSIKKQHYALPIPIHAFTQHFFRFRATRGSAAQLQ
jgi:hypothetical protein